MIYVVDYCFPGQNYECLSMLERDTSLIYHPTSEFEIGLAMVKITRRLQVLEYVLQISVGILEIT